LSFRHLIERIGWEVLGLAIDSVAGFESKIPEIAVHPIGRYLAASLGTETRSRSQRRNAILKRRNVA
jgi:hypothetical protein